MITKILVPVDGSAFAEAAIPMALRLAGKTGAEVRLAMVNEPANLPPGVWAEAFLANHARYLDMAVESVNQKAPETTVTSTLLEGSVVSALRGEIEASGADLVVMSTHGHGGLTRVWLGSIADAVLRESPAPVLLIRPEEAEDEMPTAGDDVSGIVVPLDGSTFAESAIRPALEMAELFDAPVTLLRAVSYPVMISSYLPDTAEENQAFIRQAEESAADYLDLVRTRFGSESVPITFEVLVSPKPAAGVLDYVSESGADLVVMATHARHGVARAVIGSIADKVIRGSHHPVMIIHPTKEELALGSKEVA